MSVEQLITNHLDIWTAADTEKKSGRCRSSGNAGSVYGIKKLRELILELAVRGKLVPQDANDEPASELLKRIATEKARLIAEGKIKKDKPLPVLESEEVVYELPCGWNWVRFGEIAQHNSGKTLDSGRNTGTLHDYITTSNLYWGCFELANVRQMPIRDEEFDKCSAKKGDLLICEGGEAGRAAVWFYEKDICFQNHIHRARFYCEIDPYYAYRFFEKLNATGEINDHRKGVGISNMSGKALASIAFPLPPLFEQHRIVAKVDELMALCDQLENQHNNAAEAHEKLVTHLLGTLTQSQNAEDFSTHWQLISKHFDTLFTTEASIDALKQTLLQLAVMGKLVPQDLNDEPASELLKRIQAEKTKLIAEGKIKKDKPLAEITDDEKLFVLPDGWEWARLKNIVYILGDGLHGTPKYTENTGCYFVNGNNLQNGKIAIKHETKTVSLDEMEKHKKSLNERTVLVSINGTIGNVAFYNGENIILGKSACYFNLAHQIYKQYLKLLIESPYFIEYTKENVSGTTIMNLSLFSMNNFPLPIPPIEEQKSIVAKVNELMELCDQLKVRIIAANQLQQKLANVMVEQATT